MQNNNVFDDMPEAPKSPKLPKFFPDIIVKNQGQGVGWYENDFLPWLQNQDKKTLFGFGIGMVLLSGIVVISGVGVYKYQDQIGEQLSNFISTIAKSGQEA